VYDIVAVSLIITKSCISYPQNSDKTMKRREENRVSGRVALQKAGFLRYDCFKDVPSP